MKSSKLYFDPSLILHLKYLHTAYTNMFESLKTIRLLCLRRLRKFLMKVADSGRI